ncbi:MAG: pyridoxal-dependent decarboxylase, partial [Lachnospiraceae bacterium]|nr:pyridoxal-dependent decarboxylase [Lachnospiraceae bacterium]
YGASLLLSDKYRHLAKGIEYADSLSWDMHKWLMQCYSCSAIIVKNVKNLANAYTTKHEYLDDDASTTAYDAMDISIEMSRPHRALPFWLSLQATGLDEIEKDINNTIEYAEYAHDEFKKCSDIEITSKPSCAALTFRFIKDGKTNEELNTMNAAIAKEITTEGVTYVVTTILEGKRVLRLCILNCAATKDDVTMTIESIIRCGEKVLKNY